MCVLGPRKKITISKVTLLNFILLVALISRLNICYTPIHLVSFGDYD
jgi:hypothetical protein